MRMPQKIAILVAAGIALCTAHYCQARQTAPTHADEYSTWDSAKLYAHGSSLTKKGIQLNEAIAVLNRATRRDKGRYEYQLALGSAYAARFASVAVAYSQYDAYTKARIEYDKQIEARDRAQNDAASPRFGAPRPEEPLHPRTPDDGKPFMLGRTEAEQTLVKLGRQSASAYEEARRLVETSPVALRRDVEYERGWGLFLLRRFGKGVTTDEARNPRESARGVERLEVSQRDVIGCFERCTLLDPARADGWQSLGLAHVPKTIFAVEYDTVQQYANDVAINPSKDDEDAISAFKKALELKPRDFDLLYQASLISYSAEPAFSTDSLDKAAQRMSANAVLWYQLAYQRLKRAGSSGAIVAQEMNTAAVADVQSGNGAAQYWAVPIALPAPSSLKAAWAYIPSYGFAEDHLILQLTLQALGEFASARDAQADVPQFMDITSALMNMGLKAVGSMDAQDLDFKQPRARTMRWARVFMGVTACTKAYGLVQQSQRAKPDNRKLAFLEAQQEVMRRLQTLEQDVINAPM